MKFLVALNLAILVVPVIVVAQEPTWGLSSFEATMLNEPLSSVPRDDLPQLRSILYKAQQKMQNQLRQLHQLYTNDKQAEVEKILGIPIPFEHRIMTAAPGSSFTPIRNAWNLFRNESEAREFGADVIDCYGKIAAAKKSGHYGLQTELDEANFSRSYYYGCSNESSKKIRDLMQCGSVSLKEAGARYDNAQLWESGLESQVYAMTILSTNIKNQETNLNSLKMKIAQIDGSFKGPSDSTNKGRQSVR